MTELLEQIKAQTEIKTYLIACKDGQITLGAFLDKIDDLATRYATEVAKRSLEKAAQGLHVYTRGYDLIITDESNISL